MLKSERIDWYRRTAFEAYRAANDAKNELEAARIIKNYRESGLTPQIESAAASGRLGQRIKLLRVTALYKHNNRNRI